MEHQHQQVFTRNFPSQQSYEPICPDVPINNLAWPELHNYGYLMEMVPQQPLHFIPPNQYIVHSPYFLPSAPTCLRCGNCHHELLYTEVQPQCLPTVVNLQQHALFRARVLQQQAPFPQNCSLRKRKRTQYLFFSQHGPRGLHQVSQVMIPATQPPILNLQPLPVFKIPNQQQTSLHSQQLLGVQITSHQQLPPVVQQLPVINIPKQQPLKQAPPLKQLPLMITQQQPPYQVPPLQQGSAQQHCVPPPLQKFLFKKPSENPDELLRLLQPGLILNKTYEVACIIGEGAFGKVVECIDHKNGTRVAIKVIKTLKRKQMLALYEVGMLKTINSLDPEKKFAFVKMLEWFKHKDHVCIVFELLGISTHDFLYKSGHNHFTVKHIRHMAGQIFRAMNVLHKQKIVHTDLKPDNILFVDSGMRNYLKMKEFTMILQSPDVKVADFGNCVHLNTSNTGLVTTQPYRAPEVVLGLMWAEACDVWSLGCVLLEYYVGFPLFQALNNKTHLETMEKVLGPIPIHMLQNRWKQEDILDDTLACDDQSSQEQCKSRKPFLEYMRSATSDHVHLFDLLWRMLIYDPSKRITLEAALKHPFFRS